ncbi:hypothetical protein F935_01797 [Acinetobacter calcoaceticus ANC 3811]|uniref:Alpha/beta hydrolase fold-3 domain-containing protein n=1 Tax=Acinetobacter calcoaceticus ANC 3811 TaxID=1217690 RepID=R8XZW2_ACICA|nr:alpha/beta hydrolase [Acinetobacter calcoaceticus]EOQ62708.1 hypothetical protein F935_01797 [Acinetobacter calcoaceticus ANC 3811]
MKQNIVDQISESVVKAGLRLSFKLASGLPLPFPILRGAMEFGSSIFKPRTDVKINKIEIKAPLSFNKIKAETALPNAQVQGVLLHCHGGAFFAGSSRTHRALSSEFAARANVKVYMLDYRRAPEHPYPAALNDVKSFYQYLIKEGWEPKQIFLGGDSGGCALALALAIELRDTQQELPAGIIMISPYVDITLRSPSVRNNIKRDPMIKSYALKRGGDGYRGEFRADDPLISPLFANLKNLPPLLIQAGSEEILVDDAIKLAKRAQDFDVTTELSIYENMWHNFQMFNRFIKKSDLALDEIAHFMGKVLAQTKNH